jgi:type IV pilus biogenesis protein CpaD/CtpE
MNCNLTLAVVALALAMLTLTGCATHNPNAFRTVLDPSCLLAPIVIEDCDANREPVYCRKIRLRYRHGCEKIEVVQAKK